jgi:hypothetical protein
MAVLTRPQLDGSFDVAERLCRRLDVVNGSIGRLGDSTRERPHSRRRDIQTPSPDSGNRPGAAVSRLVSSALDRHRWGCCDGGSGGATGVGLILYPRIVPQRSVLADVRA